MPLPRKVCSEECDGGRHSGTAPYRDQCQAYRKAKYMKRMQNPGTCVVRSCTLPRRRFSTGRYATQCALHQGHPSTRRVTETGVTA